MTVEKLPDNTCTYLYGLLVSVAMIAFCVLLGVALFSGTPEIRHSLVMSGIPEIIQPADDSNCDDDSEPIVTISFRSMNRYRGLTEQGRSTIGRTMFLTSGTSGGSGFMITATLMVTANHVLRNDTDPVNVYCSYAGEDAAYVIEGQILATEPENDVAFIQVEGCLPADAPIISFRTELPFPTERLHMFGYQLDSEESGRLNFVGLHRPTSFIPHISPDCATGYPESYEGLAGLAQHGNSGGPVLDDDGVVVGMLIRQQPDHNRSVMVPMLTIESLALFNGLLPEK